MRVLQSGAQPFPSIPPPRHDGDMGAEAEWDSSAPLHVPVLRMVEEG